MEPGIDERAARLADTLPERDREAGCRLIAERILPSAVDGLPADHDPEPALGVVAEAVEEVLAGAPPEERLDALEGLALESELEVAHRAAMDLAVGRFAQRHEVPEAAALWFTPRAARWAAAPQEALEEEAAARRAALDRWKGRVDAGHPRIWDARRRRWVEANHWLGAAATGSFETSSGRLNDFLRAAGVPTGDLRSF